ncbi:MAG: hypothetical protein ACLTMP_14510 [Eggerthella lenta]
MAAGWPHGASLPSCVGEATVLPLAGARRPSRTARRAGPSSEARPRRSGLTTWRSRRRGGIPADLDEADEGASRKG